MARRKAQTILDRWSLGGTNAATEHRSPIKVPEGLIKSPSGGPDGSKHLPWDKNSLPVPVPFRQGLLALHHGSACARAASAILCPGDGINAIASNRSACACCVAGRRPNANSGDAASRKTAGNTPKPSVNAVAGAAKRLKPGHPSHLLRFPASLRQATLPRRARGHAARNILTIFAIVQAVLTRCVLPIVHRLVTAATRAARLCGV